MRLIIILIAALWGIFAVLALVRTRDKSLEAKLTAGYIVVWPALVVILLINEPVPMWIAVPTRLSFDSTKNRPLPSGKLDRKVRPRSFSK